jgi:hypothetical protein
MPIHKDKKKGRHIAKQKWVWREEQELAFTKLKHLLVEPPILGFPYYSISFELHTDASIKGLGAVLYQTQEGKKRVISYASRGLTISERNYPAHKMEFLALTWAATEKFKDYLYRNSFIVYTDNNSPTYILMTAELDATGHRWLAELSNYNFKIVYRPGKSNQDADGLSRVSEDKEDVLEKDSIKATCTEGLVDSIAIDANILQQTITGIQISDNTKTD